MTQLALIDEPPPSPYLPGTKIQFAWDSTSLGALKKCPRYYYYTVIEGWEPKDESVHLRFGILYHRAMEWYDRSRAKGIKHEEALFDVVRQLIVESADFESTHEKKNRETLFRAVVWYLDKYKDTSEETYILANGKPAVELTFRFGLVGMEAAPSYTYMLSGHLDKVVRYSGDLYSRDYKSVYTFWNQRWEPDNQMTLYSFAAKVILNAPIKGVMVDMVTFKTKDGLVYPEFERAITTRTSDQIDEWVHELPMWFQQAERYAKLDYWPMNDNSCGMYGGCRFRDVCSKSPSVRQMFLESDFTQKPPEERWNPLKAR